MIDKQLFDLYKRALDGNAELIQAEFSGLLAQLKDMPAAEIRAMLKALYPLIVEQYGSYAAVASMEFYEMVREQAQLPTRYDASAFIPDNEKLLAYDAGQLVTGADIEKMLADLQAQAIQRTMQYADETIYENARADPAHPKWALVPSAGACGWCQMIASRGFDYASKSKVENTRHPHCKCIPVIDFDTDNPSLEGYDPDALFSKYKSARDEVDKTVWDEWEALTDEERARYGAKGRGAFDHFKRNKIVDAMTKL